MQQENDTHETQSALPMRERVGLSILATDAADAANRIVEAERAGVRQIWLPQGGSGGTDTLTIAAMAAARTTQVRLGTAIVPIYPRHPVVMAHQALAIHDIAPGRLRLGIGPSHRPIIENSYGLKMTAPLAYMQEYIMVLRGLLSEGKIDYHGTFFHVTATSRTAEVPLLVSALGPKAFFVAGEISDGVLSWVCPVPYLLNQAQPALREGANAQKRSTPPLIAHVVVALSTDKETVQSQGQQFLRRYLNYPFYLHMFQEAGLPVAADESGLDVLAKELVIAGDETTVRQRLTELLANGLDELLVHPLPITNQGEGLPRLLQLLATLE
jgi:F420-dependent oxidoreductase-like protein